ncbi:hypothetical protein Mgra_00009761, partial [Meloidogyne graminicola]
TPRFLHFTIQIEKDWLINSNIRILAILKILKKQTSTNWQLTIQLFGQNKNEKIPYNTLLNITKENKNIINYENMKNCLINNELKENIEIEVELSNYFFYLRSKNSEKYFLPEELINYSDLKVSFIRILYNDKNNILIKEENELNNNNICQLKSELNYKETSKYLLPSTTPHPLLSTTTSPTKYSPSFTLPDIFSNSILNNNLNIPSTKIQYKRNYNKLPRRSTKTAQNYLTVNHYINTKIQN